MIDHHPLISIIVPCYNQAQYLDECLQSVLDQTYQNWECIIINDGSTDNSLDIIRRWCEKDNRFSCIDKENEGVTKTRNIGLDQSRGHWILMLDGDDYIAPTKLEKSLSHANNSNLIISNFNMYVNGEHREAFCDLGKYEINFNNILKGWDVDFNIPIHTALISKDLLEDTRFSKHLKAKEDWIFWLDLLHKSQCKVHYIPEILATYRENSLGASKNFASVFIDMKEANTYIYNLYDDEAKRILFEKLNLSNYNTHKTIQEQKTYIRQLQNMKLMKFYLRLRKFF